MNTSSHLLINATLRKHGSVRYPIPQSACLLGAVLPDIPLTVLWIVAYLYERYARGNVTIRLMDPMFDQLYFSHPFWISAYNLLHAPLIVITAMFLLRHSRMLPHSRGNWWFWCMAGCLVHTMLDIPTHSMDGPLLLFPLEWSIRFHSPISYWDPNYHGRTFRIFEGLLNVILLLYLLGPVIQGWRQRRSGGSS